MAMRATPLSASCDGARENVDAAGCFDRVLPVALLGALSPCCSFHFDGNESAVVAAENVRLSGHPAKAHGCKAVLAAHPSIADRAAPDRHAGHRAQGYEDLVLDFFFERFAHFFAFTSRTAWVLYL